MLSFIAQRRWLFGAAALIFAIAAITAWLMSGGGLWLSAALSASIAVAGAGVIAFTRMIAAIRELFRLIVELRQDLGELRNRYDSLSAEQETVDVLRARLALAERRLSRLAVKLEMSDELDQRPQ